MTNPNQLPQEVQDFLSRVHSDDAKEARQQDLFIKGERVGWILQIQVECWAELKKAGVPIWMRPRMIREAVEMAFQPMIMVHMDDD